MAVRLYVASFDIVLTLPTPRFCWGKKRRDTEFWALQDEILQRKRRSLWNDHLLSLPLQTTLAGHLPERPASRADTVTAHQHLEQALRTGLELNTEYTFQLILRTTAGTFPSDLIRVRTHTMSDNSGISVCFGTVQDPVVLENAKMALRDMRANGAQPSGSSPIAPGVEYQRALQLSLLVVQPHWVFACHTERKLVAITAYNLGATPPTPARSTCRSRCPRSHGAPQASAFVNQPFSAMPPLVSSEVEETTRERSVMEKRMSRTKSMNSSPPRPCRRRPCRDPPSPSNVEMPAIAAGREGRGRKKREKEFGG
ncbi:hypothetical protein C8R47DRAFT_1228661 [Mycena vitilis]|nr:hypothetical protein C8R47DRAFT_1228661 [Mycena vitilis]